MPPGNLMTLKDAICLVSQLKEHEKEKEELSAKIKIIQGKIDRMESQVVSYMTENDIDSFKCDHGNIGINTRRSFLTPKGDAVSEFRSWLSVQPNRQELEELFLQPTYHSVNNYCKAEYENAMSRGDLDWTPPPGVVFGSSHKTLSIRSK